MSNLFSLEGDTLEKVTLSEWVSNHHSEDDLRRVFLNMDMALKYIHDHGYCIEMFYPSEIEILGNEVDHVQFKKLLELSKDPNRKRDMIKEDIFNSSLIQIGIYSNSLRYLKPDFLRENFDSFTQFIPSGDVPYYRGVVQRGASVYFCEYATEKRNKDLNALEKELGEGGESQGKQLTKTSNKNIGVGPMTNDMVNDKIYAQINGRAESAFVRFLVLPTLILVVLLMLGVVAWCLSFI